MTFAFIDILTGFSIDMLKVILILLVGFVAGNVLKKILMKFFDITGILNLTKNNAIGKGLADIGYKGGLLELIVDILKWTIYLIGLIASAEIVKLTGISDILKNMLIFVPKLLTGVIIILFGILITDFIGKIIKESTENKNKPHLNEINRIASEFIQFLLYFITLIMAFQIIGLDMTVIMVVLTIVLATIGLFVIVALQDDPEFVLLDIRTTPEIDAGHLSGAVALDFYSDTYRDDLAALDRDLIYLIYCRTGNRTGQTYQIMEGLGFEQVYDMGGGITQLIAAGYPVCLGALNAEHTCSGEFPTI